MFVFIKPLVPQAGCSTWSIFKQSVAGSAMALVASRFLWGGVARTLVLNSDFSLLLNQLPYLGLRTQSALFTYCCRENRWIHSFLKSISFLCKIQIVLFRICIWLMKFKVSRLIGFYGISTLIGYLMPNPIYIYIYIYIYIICKCIFCR